MNAIVIGATGATGRGIVTVLAGDSRIGHITAVVRRECDARATYVKVKDSDLSKIKILVVDYNDLDLNLDESSTFSGFDIGFTALGLYTGAASEDEWMKIEHDVNVAIAKKLHAGGTKRFAYLSGSGVVSDHPERSSRMFVRVKGTVENSLRDIGFERLVCARSGGILGRKEVGAAPAYPAWEWAVEWLKYTPIALTPIDLGAAMVHGVLKGQDAAKAEGEGEGSTSASEMKKEKEFVIYEATALNRLSKEYWKSVNV